MRLFLLSSHYRSPIDFSDQNLKESEKALDKIYGLLKRLEQEAGSAEQTHLHRGDSLAGLLRCHGR